MRSIGRRMLDAQGFASAMSPLIIDKPMRECPVERERGPSWAREQTFEEAGPPTITSQLKAPVLDKCQSTRGQGGVRGGRWCNGHLTAEHIDLDRLDILPLKVDRGRGGRLRLSGH